MTSRQLFLLVSLCRLGVCVCLALCQIELNHRPYVLLLELLLRHHASAGSSAVTRHRAEVTRVVHEFRSSALVSCLDERFSSLLLDHAEHAALVLRHALEQAGVAAGALVPASRVEEVVALCCPALEFVRTLREQEGRGWCSAERPAGASALWSELNTLFGWAVAASNQAVPARFKCMLRLWRQLCCVAATPLDVAKAMAAELPHAAQEPDDMDELDAFERAQEVPGMDWRGAGVTLSASRGLVCLIHDTPGAASLRE
jgi:hypothetical protein